MLRDMPTLEWIVKGTCDAGDIRVHHQVKSLPNIITVIGKAISVSTDNIEIIKHKYIGGIEKIFARNQIYKNINEFLKDEEGDQIFSTRIYRSLYIIMIIIAYALNFYNIRSSFCFGIGTGSIILSMLWIYYYGIHQGTVMLTVGLFSCTVGLFVSEKKQKVY